MNQPQFCHECGTIPPPGANYCVACGARLRGLRVYDALQEEVRRLRQEIDVLKQDLKDQERFSRIGGEFEFKLRALERERQLVVEALKKLEKEMAKAWQEIIAELESSILSLRESGSTPHESRSIPLSGYSEPHAEGAGVDFRSRGPEPMGGGRFESIFERLEVPSAKDLKLTLASGLAATTVMTLFLAIFMGVGLMAIPFLELLGLPFAPPQVAPALGILIHYVVGIAWALVFILVFRKARLLRGIIFSVIQTAVAIPFMAFVLLPMGRISVGGDFAQMIVTILTLWFAHVVYAMALVSSIRIMRS